MKKLIIAGAVLISVFSANAQSNEKSQGKPAPAAVPASESAAPKATQESDEKKEASSHWNAAKQQLESAKAHLSKVKNDPANQREIASRGIDAALQSIHKALNALKAGQESEPKSKGHEGHDHSDPNHKH